MVEEQAEGHAGSRALIPAQRVALPMEHMRARLEWLYRLGVDPLSLAGKTIVVAGHKGGIGKTTVAIELAYLLGAVLLDFEWDDGSAAVSLGYRPDQHVKVPLIDALVRGTVPRVVPGGPWKPDFVPGHKDFELNQPTAAKTADVVESWAKEWGRDRGCPLVVDTHPGGSPSTLGAVAAAHLVIAPAVLGEKQMEALAGMLDELAEYPLMVVPIMVGIAPPARYVNWLERLTREAGVPVAPVIRRYDWLMTRARRMAITAAGRPVSKRARPLVNELHQLGKAVVDYVGAA